MITTTFLTGLIAASLLVLAALAADHVISRLHLARRWGWTVALALTVGIMAASPWLGAVTRTWGTDPSVRGGAALVWLATTSGIDFGDAASGLPGNPWIAVGWAAASTAVGGWYLIGGLLLRRRRRAWRSDAFGDVALLVSRNVGPAVLGFLRPAIVVPQWVMTMGSGRLALVVRHELEHITARDQWLLMFARIATVVMPWHPAVWFMVRRLRRAIEIDCDSRVLGGNADPIRIRDYCDVLLRVAARTTMPAGVVAAMFDPSTSLRTRIDAMTRPRSGRPGALPLGSAIVTAVILALLAVGVPAGVVAARDGAVGRQAQESAPPVPTDTPGLVLPVVRREVRPEYTPEAIRRRIEGVAQLEALVDVEGRPRNVRIVQSIDSEYGLDEEAVVAVEGWLFRPAQLDGEAVPVEVTIQMEFRLRDD